VLHYPDERSEGVEGMTANRIRESALRMFAEHGYEGASLAIIASEVGIKKQSIYTHFSGKDELFQEVFLEAMNKQIRFLHDYFSNKQKQDAESLLYGFLKGFFVRYEEDDGAKFFLRSIFFPPAHMKDMTGEQGNQFVHGLEDILVPIMEEAKDSGVLEGSLSSRTAAIAYTAVLDAIWVELLYAGPERGMERLKAAWLVYWRGVGANRK
jgi:AcrR family transcriptional regulator